MPDRDHDYGGVEMMSYLRTLFDEYDCDKGFRHSYEVLYEPEFEPIRYNTLNILEVGILDGASIKVWLDYFPNATVWAIDTFERIPSGGIEVLSHPRVHAIDGNSQDKGIVTRFQYPYPLFDIVIDDGEHDPMANLRTFEALYPLLSQEGVYYIEDFVPSHIDPEVHPQRMDKWNPDVVTSVIVDLIHKWRCKYRGLDSRLESGKDNSFIVRLTKDEG